ncbi:response regulator [Amphibacillus jilinensis]|uniref:response regulator n=1 Tax=Amphibacillus jilinensis TaxID=1216008 RepID=UPI000310D7EE|nr:response regulator [Amphibacillus jilinensis]
MIKLLVVDDEEIERKSMLMILSKAFNNIDIKEAKNGKVAVNLAKTYRPDLVLMDIKMPGISGLEAILEIKKDLPKVECIMVTAYDTFAYAKQAIKLGVKDYLLKPSKVNEIIEIVGQVIAQIENEQRLHAEQLKQEEHFQKAKRAAERDMVTQLLFDHVHDIHLSMLVDALHIKTIEHVFVIVFLLPEGQERQYAPIVERIKQKQSIWVGPLYGRQFPVIVGYEGKQSYRARAIAIIQDSLKVIDHHAEHQWLVGVGQPYPSLSDLKKSYHQSLIALVDMTGSSTHRFYQDIPSGDNGCDQQLRKYRTQLFFDQVRFGEWDQVIQKWLTFIQCYKNEGAPLQKAQQRILEMVWMMKRILEDLHLEFEWEQLTFYGQTYQAFIDEAKHFLTQMKSQYMTHYQALSLDRMQQVKQYIIDHAYEDISLERLSEQVGLSPIYISKMFKEKLGVNYIEFLTECRIEKAKALLADPEKSIKAISFEIGYHDPNYFSKVFKKMTNVSPKTYRDKLWLKENVSQ